MESVDLTGIAPDRRRTTISVYEEDANRLRTIQRELSFRRGSTLIMPDPIHELLGALDDARERRGNGG